MDAVLIEFLKQNQWSAFYRSILYQFNQRGSLSPRQIESIQNAYDRAQGKPVTDTAPKRAFSLNVGQTIEIKAWIARRIQADLNMDYFFRNLEIVDVANETAKAYQVTVKFVSKVVTSCHVCGRDLDTEVSKACGIGPVCADRLGLPRPTLERAEETLKALEALCGQLGTIGPIWLPKSQIKTESV